jgi:hypothetical protein
MSEVKEGMKKGFDLTADEHLQAEELIGELQDRIGTLDTRKDSHLKTTNRANRYEPTIHTIKVGDQKIILKVRASELRVSMGGRAVISVTGLHLDEIDFDGTREVMSVLHHYMVLDDLASI